MTVKPATPIGNRQCLVTLAVLVITFGAIRACAQATEFEVASIKKRADTSGPWSTQHPAGGRFSGQNLSARLLIQQAFNIEQTPFQLTGGPGWIGTETYDINAKIESQDRIGNEQLQLLLQSLLASRFKLAYHRETKEGLVYALTVAKNGAKLQSAADPQGRQIENWGNDHLNALNVPVAEFARVLQSRLGRVVVDETGIQGAYDFRLTWIPDTAADTSGPSIFTALPEQYGLRLESRKGPIETIVIDHIEHPTED